MNHSYNDIISIKNLCEAWREFIRGKKCKKDVAEFSLNLSRNIFDLHEELKNKTYRHGGYEVFTISDPKPRIIHKATVGDRLLHHAIYRVLYPYFDKNFIHDSYSSRNAKGTHRALNRFKRFTQKVSHSDSRACWVLKCDVRKFFASIDQRVLLGIVEKHISDPDTIRLIRNVVESFSSGVPGRGLPLGNLTSQLLANVYMNELDQYVKHLLKQKYYVRYADDFLVLRHKREALAVASLEMRKFLDARLKLKLHPDKIFIQTIHSGVDFLGWVNFYDHRILRTSTKKRMFHRLAATAFNPDVLQSYLGLISHGNSHGLKNEIEAAERRGS